MFKSTFNIKIDRRYFEFKGNLFLEHGFAVRFLQHPLIWLKLNLHRKTKNIKVGKGLI